MARQLRGRRAAGPRRAVFAGGLGVVAGATLLRWRGPGGVLLGPAGGAGAEQAAPGRRVALVWAGAQRSADPAAGDAVDLTLVLHNHGDEPTASTSILWEPAFARAFVFAESEPGPWRVRLDERGWGVLDTAGVLPRGPGTFRLRFDGAPGGSSEQEGEAPAPPDPAWAAPRIVVVADGRWVVADAVAAAGQWAPPPGAWRGAFDRGVLAAMADGVARLPADGRGGLWLLASVAALLGSLAAGGAVAAGCAAGEGVPGRWPGPASGA